MNCPTCVCTPVLTLSPSVSVSTSLRRLDERRPLESTSSLRRRSRALPGGRLTAKETLEPASAPPAPLTLEPRRRSQGGGPRGNQGFPRESLDRHHSAGARVGVPAADYAAARTRRRGRGHLARLCPDAPTPGATRGRGGRARTPRRSRESREGTVTLLAAQRAPRLGEGADV